MGVLYISIPFIAQLSLSPPPPNFSLSPSQVENQIYKSKAMGEKDMGSEGHLNPFGVSTLQEWNKQEIKMPLKNGRNPFFSRDWKPGVFPNTSGWFIVHAAPFKCSLHFLILTLNPGLTSAFKPSLNPQTGL